MADERQGKPPAITVRPESWELYDWITSAAEKRSMSRGEFLLAGAKQRRTGGPMPRSRREEARRATNGHAPSSAEAKANVQPIPKGKR